VPKCHPCNLGIVGVAAVVDAALERFRAMLARLSEKQHESNAHTAPGDRHNIVEQVTQLGFFALEIVVALVLLWPLLKRRR
jgi:hypothetical protein